MSVIIALLLFLQVSDGYGAEPQPITEPAYESRYSRFSIDRAQAIPPVYPSNYATRYLSLPAAPYSQSRFHLPPGYYGQSSMYYGGFPRYYYPSYRSVFFSRAPFARGNIRNPSPFFRSPGAPGQPPPPGARVRGGRGGAAHRR